MISIIKRIQQYNFLKLKLKFIIYQYKINFFYLEQLLLYHNHITTTNHIQVTLKENVRNFQNLNNTSI